MGSMKKTVGCWVELLSTEKEQGENNTMKILYHQNWTVFSGQKWKSRGSYLITKKRNQT